MILKFIILIAMFILPYGLFGFDLNNIILTILGLLYIATRKKMRANKSYLIITCIFALYAITSIFISNDIIYSIAGITPYLAIFVFYLFLNDILEDKDKRENLLEGVVYGVTIVSIVAIFIQCKIFHVRLEGNLGYANTFAIIVLAALYLNSFVLNIKYKTVIDIVLIVSILFTGSRTTLICYLLIILFSLVKNLINPKYLVLNNLVAVIMFILIDNYFGILLLTLPFVFIMLKQVYKIKYKKIYAVIFLVLVTTSIIVIPNNTFQRIKNISIDNGSLQERFVLFEDSFKAIAEKPMGYGINSYSNEITYRQSANYKLNFVHNSILQVAFEIGIIGGVIFIIILVWGGFLIFKNTGLSIHLIIYSLYILHSFMDFDFSFITFIIIWLLILVINEEKGNHIELENKIVYKSNFIAILIFIAFIGVNETIYIASKIFISNNEYTLARNVASKALLKDWRINSLIGDTYMEEYYRGNEKDTLNLALKYNLEALEQENNSNVKWNVAYCLKEQGKIIEYIGLMKELNESNKFNKEYYEEFENTILKYNRNNNFNEVLKWIEEKESENKGKINKKSIYMRNQL